MKNIHSHLHDRTYWGELDAASVIKWLNSATRPDGDPVEKLIELGQGRTRDWAQQVTSYLSGLVRKTKLAVAPVLTDVTAERWSVDWRLTGRIAPMQGLALVRLLHLANREGLLSRVRKCARVGCGRWFFARFRHQQFHSAKCQQQAFRADPAWRRKHAEQMRQLRHAKRLQEQRWIHRRGKKR